MSATIAPEQVDNLVNMIDGYVEEGGHHLNVNVFTKETLLDMSRRVATTSTSTSSPRRPCLTPRPTPRSTRS